MNKQLILKVTGDVDDADYISEYYNVTSLPKEEIIEIYKLLKSIENRNLSEISEEKYKKVFEYVPYCYQTIEVREIVEVELLRVEKITINDL